MRIDEAETRRIAALARLELDDATVRRFREQLESVLDHVASLDELDLSGLPPTSPPARPHAGREDREGACLSPSEATRGAPEASRDLFRVPRVIEPRDASARGADDE